VRTALHCTGLRCTALHCAGMHCTALHCTTLHFTAPQLNIAVTSRRFPECDTSGQRAPLDSFGPIPVLGVLPIGVLHRIFNLNQLPTSNHQKCPLSQSWRSGRAVPAVPNQLSSRPAASFPSWTQLTNSGSDGTFDVLKLVNGFKLIFLERHQSPTIRFRPCHSSPHIVGCVYVCRTLVTTTLHCTD
jgi:hypothetical protein